jgi:hypothetical protein
MTHFFWKLRYNITCSPKGKDPNFHLLTRLNSRFRDFSNLPAGVISSQLYLVGKLRHEATSPLKKGEPSFVPKTLKITHKQTRLVVLQDM